MIFYYLTLLLMPFDNHPILAYNYHGITPIKIAGGLSLIAALHRLLTIRNRRPIFSAAQTKYLLLFAMIFFASALVNFSDYNETAMLRFISIIIFYIATVILVDTRERFIASFILIAFSMNVASLYVFREYSLYSNIYEEFRPGGILNDPNYTALNLLLFMPVVYLLYGAAKRKMHKIFLLGSFAIYIGAFALCQSRGGIIGLAVQMVVALYYMRLQIGKIILMGITAAVIITFMPVSITHRFTDTESAGVKKSTEMRFALIYSGLAMVKDNPGLGVGPGNFKEYSRRYSEDVQKRQIAHNSYLELAAELGIFGLLFFFMTCIRTLKELKKAIILTSDDMLVQAILKGMKIGIIGYLVTSVFLSAEYENLIWLFVFLVISSENFISQKASDNKASFHETTA
jgi:O-antigen ligase